MITPERFSSNFQYLQTLIPTKPIEYTPEYPDNVNDSFKLYLRQSALNLLQTTTMSYIDEEWPLPMWFDPNHIRIGFINRLNYNKFSQSFTDKKSPILDWYTPYSRVIKYMGKIPNKTPIWDYLLFPFINKHFFNQDFSESMVVAFDCNFKYIERKISGNPTLYDKKAIIHDVFVTYKKGLYIGSITTIFPLLDYVARRFLKVKKLNKDVRGICKLFESCGYGFSNADHLMSFAASMRVMGKVYEENGSIKGWGEATEKIKETNLGMIGPLLSSFLKFANSYYSHFQDENDKPPNTLNRHGILHGSITSFGTKVNVVKLITFLYLFLELEPVFEILMDTND